MTKIKKQKSQLEICSKAYFNFITFLFYIFSHQKYCLNFKLSLYLHIQNCNVYSQFNFTIFFTNINNSISLLLNMLNLVRKTK